MSHAIALPEGWRIAYTNDGKIYYQNDTTHQTQWDPPVSQPTITTRTTESLPEGWRTVYTNDGKPYYQNDVTQQTQWNPPTLQQSTITTEKSLPVTVRENKSSQPQPNDATPHPPVPDEQTHNETIDNKEDNLDDDDDEYKSAGAKKIWDKNHIMWLCVFIVTIYDYITDCQVVGAWLNMDFICKWPTYQCNLLSNENAESITPTLVWFAVILLIGSTVGFLCTIILQIYEGKHFYLAYKYPINKSDETSKQLERYKRSIYLSWITMLFENMLSVFLIIATYVGGSVRDMKYLGDLYRQSLVMSVLSILVSLALNTRKRIKLSQSAAHKETNQYKNAIRCQCCWLVLGSMITVVMLIAVCFIAFGENDKDPRPVVFLQDPTTDTGVDTCRIYEDDEKARLEDRDMSYGGGIDTDILSLPDMVGGCARSDLRWYLNCEEDEDEVELDCVLEWKGDCSRGSCYFTLAPNQCAEYTVQCDAMDDSSLKFWETAEQDTLWEGNAVMFACFDYCPL